MLDFMNTFTIDEVFRFAGVLGFLAYISGFAALQLQFINGSGFKYTMINIIAASLVLISLIADFNLASALIQVSWICIGLIGLAKRAWFGPRSAPLQSSI